MVSCSRFDSAWDVTDDRSVGGCWWRETGRGFRVPCFVLGCISPAAFLFPLLLRPSAQFPASSVSTYPQTPQQFPLSPELRRLQRNNNLSHSSPTQSSYPNSIPIPRRYPYRMLLNRILSTATKSYSYPPSAPPTQTSSYIHPPRGWSKLPRRFFIVLLLLRGLNPDGAWLPLGGVRFTG